MRMIQKMLYIAKTGSAGIFLLLLFLALFMLGAIANVYFLTYVVHFGPTLTLFAFMFLFWLDPLYAICGTIGIFTYLYRLI